MRLLYVEDEVSMAKTIGAILHQSGYQFDNAYCGQEAMDLAESNAYDLILLDIMLPDFDGYEVISRLRLNGVETPFLIQTGIVGRENEADKASLGVIESLIKPFNRSELIQGIERVVRRQNVVDQALKDSPFSQDVPFGPVSGDKRRRSENRRHRRFRSMKSAEVVHPYRFDCKLLNVSYSGAAICLPHPDRELASRIKLSIDDAHVMDCQVCWRLGDKVGVKFL